MEGLEGDVLSCIPAGDDLELVESAVIRYPVEESGCKFMCSTPITLKRTYRTIKGELTNVVPCGKCLLCLRRRQSAWSFRLYEEMKVSESACFLTLTYTDLSLPYSMNGFPTLDKTDYQRFMKRLRKAVEPVKLKYYSCGEYGTTTHRPHYHSIMFNLPQAYLRDPQRIEAHWSFGHVRLDPCNLATIGYVTKYIMKGHWEPKHDTETGLMDDRLPQFSLKSNGLGKKHLTPAMKKYYKENQISHVTLPGGIKLSMPRYYRDKVYSKQERKQIAMEGQKVMDAFNETAFADEWHRVCWIRDQDRKRVKLDNINRQKL